MELIELIQRQNVARLAVVGMAKNSGKTVALNKVIREGAAKGIRLGLTSAGRDGEKRDVLWKHLKPAVWAPAGSLAATVSQTGGKGCAGLEVLAPTGFSCALGPVMVYKVCREGRLELAGPATARQLDQVTRQLAAMGAGLCLVDGAFDRVAAASPKVTDGIILATGAVLSPDPEEVLAQTKSRVNQLTIPGAALPCQFTGTAKVSLWLEDGTFYSSKWSSALGSAAGIAEEARQLRAKGLLLGGALLDELLIALKPYLLQRGSFYVIVQDATKILVSDSNWRSFREAQGEVLAARPVNLLAVTVNPWSPAGWRFEAADFLARARQALAPVPVFDPAARSY